MGNRIGTMHQEASGLTVDVYEGWSWPAFCFGSFWYLAKGLWGIGLLWLALSLVSGSALHWIGLLFMPTMANRQYREHLGARGYRFQPLAEETPEERTADSEQRTGYAILVGLILLAGVVAALN